MFRRRNPGRRARRPETLKFTTRLRIAQPALRAMGLTHIQDRRELLHRLERSDKFKDGRWRISRNPAELLTGNYKMDKSADLSPRRQRRLENWATRVGYTGALKGILTRGLTLAPDVESGLEMCERSTHCAAVCLAHATGQNQGDPNQRVRIRRTLYWWLFPDEFHARIRAELDALRCTALADHMLPAARLNVGSDVAWEEVAGIANDATTKYGYTKLGLHKRKNLPDNWRLTYSVSEAKGSLAEGFKWLDAGHNAVIVVGPVLPQEHLEELRALDAQLLVHSAQSPERVRLLKRRRTLAAPGKGSANAKAAAARLLANNDLYGYRLIDGDEDDARFLDEPGHIVVLAAKGPAFWDQTGFVTRIRPDGTPELTAQEKMAREIPWSVLQAEKKAFRALLSPVQRMQLEDDYSTVIGLPRGRRDVRPPTCVAMPVPWQVGPWGGAL